ncbi:MAG: sulfite exporter TauE/SafE family protein [Elusimicrobia bacterium]|nr:sulfite exporter TauE/SafE family protein [Elusimicrobiota bacterium]
MPELTLLNFSALVAFGFVIGLLGSVLGIGGGVFMVPFLVLALKIPIHQAVAVSLVAIAATSSAVASVNVERGLTNMRLGIVFETTMALGSVLSALVASRLPASAVQLMFALALFPISAVMFMKGWRAFGATKHEIHAASSADGGKFDAAFFDPALKGEHAYRVKNVLPGSLFSFFGGVLSGLLGLGGGIVQVPVMTLICGVPMKAAAATSNFMIGVSAAASAFVYFKKGYILPELASVIVIGVLLGSFLGIHALYKARSEKIQMAFSVLTLLVAVKMLMKAM